MNPHPSIDEPLRKAVTDALHPDPDAERIADEVIAAYQQIEPPDDDCYLAIFPGGTAWVRVKGNDLVPAQPQPSERGSRTG